uniref:Uncharacterized protein n=1 Tax=Lactuca sativa TaxID=4236 RepID=A0A9R1VFB9_LACSA|nr:hypothetical protein LSAT_V11C500235860 [Lactuca sativa]
MAGFWSVCYGSELNWRDISLTTDHLLGITKLNRIPSAVELKNRGVIILNTTCDETCDHILLTCHAAKAIMDSILVWCEIRCDRFISVENMLIFISRWSKYKYKRRMLNAILCGKKQSNNWIFEKTSIVISSVCNFRWSFMVHMDGKEQMDFRKNLNSLGEHGGKNQSNNIHMVQA